MVSQGIGTRQKNVLQPLNIPSFHGALVGAGSLCPWATSKETFQHFMLKMEGRPTLQKFQSKQVAINQGGGKKSK